MVLKLQVEWLILVPPEKVAAAQVAGCRSSVQFQFVLKPRAKTIRWSGLSTRERMAIAQSLSSSPCRTWWLERRRGVEKSRTHGGGGHKRVNVVAEWEAFWGRTSIRAIRAVRREKWGGCDERWDSERRGRPPYPVNQRMSEWGGIEYRLEYFPPADPAQAVLAQLVICHVSIQKGRLHRRLHGTGLELSNQRATVPSVPPMGALSGHLSNRSHHSNIISCLNLPFLLPLTSKPSLMPPWPSTQSRPGKISATINSHTRSTDVTPPSPYLLCSKNRRRRSTNSGMAITG